MEKVAKENSKPGPKRSRELETKLPLGLRSYHSDRVAIEKAHGSAQEFWDKSVEKDMTDRGYVYDANAAEWVLRKTDS